MFRSAWGNGPSSLFDGHWPIEQDWVMCLIFSLCIFSTIYLVTVLHSRATHSQMCAALVEGSWDSALLLRCFLQINIGDPSAVAQVTFTAKCHSNTHPCQHLSVPAVSATNELQHGGHDGTTARVCRWPRGFRVSNSGYVDAAELVLTL